MQKEREQRRRNQERYRREARLELSLRARARSSSGKRFLGHEAAPQLPCQRRETCSFRVVDKSLGHREQEEVCF